MNKFVPLTARLHVFFGLFGLFLIAIIGFLSYLVFSYLPQQQAAINALQARLSNSESTANKIIDTTHKEITQLEQKNAASAALAAAGVQEKTNRDLSAIVKEWSPSVPLVSCAFQDEGGVYSFLTGSGMLVTDNNGGVEVWTNSHVVNLSNAQRKNIPASMCTFSFPDRSSFTVDNVASSASFDEATDVGTVYINNPSTALRKAASKNLINRACSKKENIGDQLLILGYPSIGADGGITVTEGIISGVEGDYYVTSAKIERGNSGGIAIDVKDDCYLGIPTFVRSGNFESLGRILMWQSFASRGIGA